MKYYFALIIRLFFVIGFFSIFLFSYGQEKQDSLILDANNFTAKGAEFLSNGNYKQAEFYFKKSIDTWDHITSYSPYSAYPYFQLGALYRIIGDYENGITFYNKAERILLEAADEDKYLLGGLYDNIGFFYLSYGDNQKSLEYYNRSISILEPFKDQYQYIYYDAVYGIAQNLYLQKKYEEALKIANDALLHKPGNFVKLERLVGNINIETGNFKTAIELLSNVKKEYTEDKSRYSESLLLLSKAYTKNDNLVNAQKCLNEALPILKAVKSDNDPWMIYYYEIYGQFLIKKAESVGQQNDKLVFYKDAVSVFDKALILNSRSNDNKLPYLEEKAELITPTQVKDVFMNRSQALNAIGKIYEKQKDQFTANIYFDRALKTADANIQFLHDLRISFLDEESKLSLSEQYDKVYLDGFKIADHLYTETRLPGYFEQLLKFSEAGKSATFLASLNDIKAKNFGGIPDSLVQKERSLTMQLSNLKQLKFNEQNQEEPDSALISELDKSIFNLQNQHDELIFLFERDYADFYDFKYKNVTITSEEIIDKLNRNQALVEYFVDEPAMPGDTGCVYTMVFSADKYTFHKVPITYDYVQDLQTIISELTSNKIADSNLKDFHRYTSSAYALYRTLIEPLNLSEKLSDLIIVPDGRMSYIPFDALITKPSEENGIDYRKLSYLVYKYNTSYSYSATLHFDYFKSNKKHGRNILAFAPDYTNTEIDLNQAAYRNRQVTRTILRPLPGAKDEVLGLSKLQKCTALIGHDASETNFKKMAINYDILHLAMHTIINDSIPMFSKLVFSVPEDSIDDGYLNTQEIYNLKLDARLAVLSACNTGSGQMRSGEGVMSLSRAFLYAGCPSIIMTLWEVEDKVSAEIMLNFYRYLFKGYSKAEALRKAKLKHIQHADPLKAHPYFWLGYILVGDPSPIKFNNNVLISIIIFSVILFLLWHFIYRFIKERKKKSFPE